TEQQRSRNFQPLRAHLLCGLLACQSALQARAQQLARRRLLELTKSRADRFGIDIELAKASGQDLVTLERRVDLLVARRIEHAIEVGDEFLVGNWNGACHCQLSPKLSHSTRINPFDRHPASVCHVTWTAARVRRPAGS